MCHISHLLSIFFVVVFVIFTGWQGVSVVSYLVPDRWAFLKVFSSVLYLGSEPLRKHTEMSEQGCFINLVLGVGSAWNIWQISSNTSESISLLTSLYLSLERGNRKHLSVGSHPSVGRSVTRASSPPCAKTLHLRDWSMFLRTLNVMASEKPKAKS